MTNTIKLDRKEISQKIEAGDNGQGDYFLAVTPSGETSIHWADTNRQWDPWPTDAYVIGIPALYPEGSGLEAEDAQDCLRDNLGPAKAKELEAKLDAKDISVVDYAEEHYPDWMAASRDNVLDFKLDEFLDACNGHADNDPAPWGMRGDALGDGEVIQPPFVFVYLNQ